MKIKKSYLQKIILEEIEKIFEEIDKEKQILHIFVEMHNALQRKEKESGKSLKVVKDEPPFYVLLNNAKRDLGVDSNDLLDILEEFKDKIDLNMYEKLRDAFTNDIYEIDAEYLEPPEDEDQFDKKMSDMYQKYTGKPDLRVVK